MNNRRISIIFCGGCNPRIDRGQVAKQVRDILVARGYEVWYKVFDADFTIYMSGCTVNCALQYNNNNHPAIVVAGGTVDTVPIDKENLVNAVVMKVREYFE